MKDIINSSIRGHNINQVLFGTEDTNTAAFQEQAEIKRYYEFYDPDKTKATGQYWETPLGLDYEPTVEIRNHVKKLLNKQQRFMFGEYPTITVDATEKLDIDQAADIKELIDYIFEQSEFWDETFKAFLDATIGKRVLLLVDANPDQPVQFKYYTSDQFTYSFSKHDNKRLEEVIIAYQDKETKGKPAQDQIWYRWRYYLKYTEDLFGNKEPLCYLDKGQFTGEGDPIPETQEVGKQTIFKEIPARVILNGGTLGDTCGTSDVKDLMDIQDSYNRRMSDLSDALKFGMFEQPVAVNAHPDSVAAMKIAPNALIDLKAATEYEDMTPDMFILEKSFRFKDAIQYYLDKAVSDMYEIMDQPRPEDVKRVMSGKALKFIFYDLIARCGEKWKAWDPAVKWALGITFYAIQEFNLYRDHPGSQHLDKNITITITPNYPLHDDDEEKRKLAMQEVNSNVRSIRSYMREYGEGFDEDQELDEVVEELQQLQAARRDNFQTILNDTDPEDEMKRKNDK